MCLLLFAQGLDPRFPLVVAANRDEFHARPTQAAHWWPDGIAAGRDLQGGGTWLGVTAAGRFAALTNFRDPAQNDPQRASRGGLVVDALRSEQPPRDYLAALAAAGADYNGFNLIFGTADGLFSYNNQTHAGLVLEPGLYGLSNHLLETPWPKVTRGKALLAACLSSVQGPTVEALLDLLADRSRPEDEELPATGVGLEWERLLAPMFIVSPAYGTRSSSVLIVRGDGSAEFAERRYDPEGNAAETRRFAFSTAPA